MHAVDCMMSVSKPCESRLHHGCSAQHVAAEQRVDTNQALVTDCRDFNAYSRSRSRNARRLARSDLRRS
jgi:hypothetical protein